MEMLRSLRPVGGLVCLTRYEYGMLGKYAYYLSREDIWFDVRRQQRKTLAIHILSKNKVEIRAPLKCSWLEIEQFLGQKLSWIINSARTYRLESLVPALTYASGSRHRFLGSFRPLVLVQGNQAYTSLDGDNIVICCMRPSSEDLVRRRLHAWYRHEAESYLPPRIAAINLLFGDRIKVPNLSIRKMRASWGSCDGRSNIRINSLIMRESPRAIDFVLAHELCHLRYFQHDKGFYARLSEVMPDWRELERQLTKWA
ncbi:MAG: hypothetical protein CMP95_08350 [Gammaproteobacteria bacterium]|nr:hypothetical protein [Gammaproteobacteria bacterium]